MTANGQWSKNSSKIYYNGGNVGIGTNDPLSKIHITDSVSNGAVEFRVNNTASTGYSKFIMYNEAGNAWGGFLINNSASNLGSYNETSFNTSHNLTLMTDSGFQNGGTHKITFLTGGWDASTQTRMTIASDGNVGIGQATPSKLLHVGSSSVSSGTAVASFQNVNGTCTITPASSGSGIACSSDERLKENFRNISGSFAIDRISQLQAVTYNFKTSPVENRRTGFKAQEILKIAPEFVRQDDDGLLQVYYDAFIPWITEAIKNLHLRITKLESNRSELEKLKVENEALKIRVQKAEDENANILKRLESLERRMN